MHIFNQGFPQKFYNLQKLKRKNVEGKGRHYITPEGKMYPSVTNVLSVLPNKSLEEWRKRVGEARANEISNKAMTYGTKVHKAIETYMGNVEPKFQSIFVKAHFENIKPLLHNINKIKSQEVFLYSDKLGMAGQVDCVAEYLGIPSIIDFKTSTKRKEEEWIEKYFLQATAYGLMWEEQTGEEIPQIVILITGEDGSLDSFIKRKSDYVDRLLEVIQLWKEKNNGN